LKAQKEAVLETIKEIKKLQNFDDRIEEMTKRICPDCGRKLTVVDRFFCSECGCKLPKSLRLSPNPQGRKNV